ncbi:MAG: hypothetical protein LBD67_01710 [Candidatus Accumulibacter sp.]|nr:hypothetical protein [Accumulibacter sp.]
MNLFRFVAVSLFVLSPLAGAEKLTYTGNGSLLKRPSDDIAAFEGIKNALYPARASGNAVTVNFTLVKGEKNITPHYVFGALSAEKTLKRNTVWLKKGTSDNLYGAASKNGEVSGNAVVIGRQATRARRISPAAAPAAATPDIIAGVVYGGASFYADAKGNTVNLLQEDAALDVIHGGFSGDSAAKANSVAIRAGKVSGIVSGGSSKNGAVEKNTVHVSGGQLGQVYGGVSLTGPVRSNVVRVTDGRIPEGRVTGGLVKAGLSAGNAVYIQGGHMNHVIGGMADKGRAVGNHVKIGGGRIESAITGGSVTFGEGMATKNTVVLGGRSLMLGKAVWLRGGQTPAGDAFTDNRLHIENPIEGEIFGLENFEMLRFRLPSSITPGAVMLNVGKGGALLSDRRAGKSSVIELLHADNLTRLKEGDTIALIRTDGMIGAPPENHVILDEEFQGAGKKAWRYRFRVDISDDGKELLATLVEAPQPRLARKKR